MGRGAEEAKKSDVFRKRWSGGILVMMEARRGRKWGGGKARAVCRGGGRDGEDKGESERGEGDDRCSANASKHYVKENRRPVVPARVGENPHKTQGGLHF